MEKTDIDWIIDFQTGITGIIGFIAVMVTLWWNAKLARDSREHELKTERDENLRIYFRELALDRTGVINLLDDIKEEKVGFKSVAEFQQRSKTPTAYSDKSFMRRMPHKIMSHIFIIEEARVAVEACLEDFHQHVARSTEILQHGLGVDVMNFNIIYEMKPHLEKLLRYIKEQELHIDAAAKR